MMWELEDDAWTAWAMATARSAIGLFVVKLIAAIVLAQLWLVPMQIRLLWNFLPTTAFFATPSQFRSLALWSTILTAAGAVLWMLRGLTQQQRRMPAETLGAFMALPMAALLVILEWSRTIGGYHLIDTSWLWRVLAVLAAAIVLFVGFWDHLGSTAGQPPATAKSMASPGRHTPSAINTAPTAGSQQGATTHQ